MPFNIMFDEGKRQRRAREEKARQARAIREYQSALGGPRKRSSIPPRERVPMSMRKSVPKTGLYRYKEEE